ncbi:MAG: NAD(P)/FAD-dependent oxidoreductase [Candidatus Theseobacter exili]|nr:NAD(P)/FAD-dependent oxidoreductase [Candidatus Theseobacter exili]
MSGCFYFQSILLQLEGFMTKYDVVVIGGGAAGLMAAGQAAESGARTLLIEKMHKPGRKLYITGKGRCNLANQAPLKEFVEQFGSNGRFLRQAVSGFSSESLVAFFKDKGVPTVIERGGRIFPASSKASDVLDALVKYIKKQGVTLLCNTEVDSLILENNKINGVSVVDRSAGNKKVNKRDEPLLKNFFSTAVILATGGASYPATGSTGDGYRIAKETGHRIIDVRPALVPLETDNQYAKKLCGLNLRNIRVKLLVNEKKVTDGFGEMSFIRSGLSGPVVLSLSRKAVDALMKKENVDVSIDLKPALDENKLDLRILRDFNNFGKKQFQTILEKLLPIKLIHTCILATGIPAEKNGNQISVEERKRLKLWLKDFRLKVTGYRPFEEAIITAGGVDVGEVDPRSMASRLKPGLFIAGEILDVDAKTGGFNLQAAFSTGWLAGRSAALQSRTCIVE